MLIETTPCENCDFSNDVDGRRHYIRMIERVNVNGKSV